MITYDAWRVYSLKKYRPNQYDSYLVNLLAMINTGSKMLAYLITVYCELDFKGKLVTDQVGLTAMTLDAKLSTMRNSDKF